MQKTHNAYGMLLAATLVASATHGLAQTKQPPQPMDALLDKMVEKGLLTSKEAGDLKQENQGDLAKNANANPNFPDWVTGWKFSGDFRGRYEQNGAESTDYHARDRYRYRLRLGLTLNLVDDFDLGFRLASGNPQFTPTGTLVGGAPITANQDLNSLSSRKFLWIDAAFARWNAIHTDDWKVTATIGKHDNPFQLSNMIYDYDIVPEGASLQVSYRLNEQHSLKTIGGLFVLDEINQAAAGAAAGTAPPSHDPFIYGGQFLLESKWNKKFETTLGLAVFDIVNKDALSAKVQPFYNSGNTRDANGFLLYNFNPIIASASATYKLDSFPLYTGTFPVKLAGEFMHNPGAPTQNDAYRAGLTLGKAGKKNTWEINYRYQRLEADAWFDAMVDDDNGAYYATGNPQLAGTGKANGWFGGTNVKGHLIQATYSLTDFLNFTFTYYMNDLIIEAPVQPSSANHFMADLNWRF